MVIAVAALDAVRPGDRAHWSEGRLSCGLPVGAARRSVRGLGGRLHELDQHAPRVLRVHEVDPRPGRAPARLVVQQPQALLPQAAQVASMSATR
ncbi:hypothetical protein BJF78_20885 [Pseudonocardia sp. CNS-139]|nr:hypothetical protein BJF78_20885 [Pseudonocardia sp. CNS-139]